MLKQDRVLILEEEIGGRDEGGYKLARFAFESSAGGAGAGAAADTGAAEGAVEAAGAAVVAAVAGACE
jgi:hypothetical protein